MPCRASRSIIAGVRLIVSVLLATPFSSRGDEPVPDTTAITIEDRVPFGHASIDYHGPQTNDAVSRLNEQLASRTETLTADEQHGYLRAVLKRFNISVDSQLLVYSKTARSPELVSPQNPRAMFFNDSVTVAWIPSARELEITATDPVKGTNFYTLSQPLPDGTGSTSEPDEPPQFTRRDRCLACHAGRSSLEVPGLLLRAFQTDPRGTPLVGFSRTTQDMKHSQRFGGWYVTGAPAGYEHRGNLVADGDNERHRIEPGFAASADSVAGFFDAGIYPTTSSDLVPHLVALHQMHGINLLIRVSMEARTGRRSDAEDRLLRHLTFADEPPLPVSIDMDPSSAPPARVSYIQHFQQDAIRDEAGRSLRDFDLRSRVFRYPLSWLIHHELFCGLPNECRLRLQRRVWNGLLATVSEPRSDAAEARSTPPPANDDPEAVPLFDHVPDEDRAVIRDILSRTPGWPPQSLSTATCRRCAPSR